jgi:adenylate kinase
LRLVFLGPPGAGKGTQAKLLSKEHGVPHLSTGDLLRDAMAKGTPTGRRAKEFVEKGALVPDEVVDALVGERLPGVRDRFLLDGYPRNGTQASELDRLAAELLAPLTAVIYIHVDDETLVKRVSGRRSCPKCGQVYHLEAKPPRKADVCDACGFKGLAQRPDDRAEVVRERLAVYHKNTAPLVERYKGKKLLRWIDGDRAIEAVARDVRQAAEGEAGGAGGPKARPAQGRAKA